MAPNADVDRLGALLHTFRPKKGNIIAGIILGVIFIAGGLAAGGFLLSNNLKSQTELSTRIVGLVVSIGILIVLPAMGCMLLVWMKGLLGHRVMIHEEGIAVRVKGKVDTCHWSELTWIKEVFSQDDMKVGGLSISQIDRSFELLRRDGDKFFFTVNTIDNVPLLGQYLEDARYRFDIVWKQVTE